METLIAPSVKKSGARFFKISAPQKKISASQKHGSLV